MHAQTLLNSKAAPHARHYQPLVSVLLAIGLGILVDRLYPLPLGALLAAALVAWVAWFALWRRAAIAWSAVPLALSLAACGAGWHHACWNLFAADDLGCFAADEARPICLEATALTAPRRVAAPPHDPLRTIPVGDRSRVEVAVDRVRDGRVWRKVAGRSLLVVEGHLLGVRSGDRLKIFGRVMANEPPGNPGEFDFAAEARAERRLTTLRAGFPDAVTLIARGSPWAPRAAIDRARARGAGLLHRFLSPERAGLATAMFLGVREDLSPEVSQSFMETGTIHLLVISGMNVGILVGCLWLALRVAMIPPGWALALVALTTVTYALVTDAQPPVVRATAAVLVMCLSRALGRQAPDLNVWAGAALVVLAINPAELFRSGTQLSFLCMAVLIQTDLRLPLSKIDPLDRLIAQSRPRAVRVASSVREYFYQLLLASAVIWMVTCPLVMARFHLASPAAVVLGPILAIPVMMAMGAGFVVLLCGAWMPWAGQLAGRVCDVSLQALVELVDRARGVPGSHFWTTGPANWWLIGFYGALAWWTLDPQRLPRRWQGALLAGWTALGLGLAWLEHRPSDQLVCTFLSVGHGNAVVVELPGGQTLLYDAGRLGSPVAPARAISGFLWSRGITRLDGVILSHADADHYNALPQLLSKFSVGRIYVSPLMFERHSGALDALAQAIDRSGVPLVETYSGDRLRAANGCRLEVTHPPEHGVLGSDNANSIVLAIEYQGQRLLLTGDLESPGLEDVLAEQPYACDVLLAPHHGSNFSDPPGMASWCSPRWVVISGGSADRLAGVRSAYVERGGIVLHTADCGAVQAIVRNGQTTVSTWRTRAAPDR